VAGIQGESRSASARRPTSVVLGRLPQRCLVGPIGPLIVVNDDIMPWVVNPDLSVTRHEQTIARPRPERIPSKMR
jgi:hypothetical protein